MMSESGESVLKRETVKFRLKGPLPVHCCVLNASPEDPILSSSSGASKGVVIKRAGCSVVDLAFAQKSSFGNNESRKRGRSGGHGGEEEDESSSSDATATTPTTAAIGKRNIRRVPDYSEVAWEFSISKALMPSPHFEMGAQDAFFIKATESRVEWKDVVLVRFVLQQPSSVWKQFSIRDILLYKTTENNPSSSPWPTKARSSDSGLMMGLLKLNTFKLLTSGQGTVEPPPLPLEPGDKPNNPK